MSLPQDPTFGVLNSVVAGQKKTMAPDTKQADVERYLECWPGYNEQSWAERFAELDRRFDRLSRAIVDYRKAHAAFTALHDGARSVPIRSRALTAPSDDEVVIERVLPVIRGRLVTLLDAHGPTAIDWREHEGAARDIATAMLAALRHDKETGE